MRLFSVWISNDPAFMNGSAESVSNFRGIMALARGAISQSRVFYSDKRLSSDRWRRDIRVLLTTIAFSKERERRVRGSRVSE